MNNDYTLFLQIEGFDDNINILNLKEIKKLENELIPFLSQIEKIQLKKPSEKSLNKVLEFLKLTKNN